MPSTACRWTSTASSRSAGFPLRSNRASRVTPRLASTPNPIRFVGGDDSGGLSQDLNRLIQVSRVPAALESGFQGSTQVGQIGRKVRMGRAG